MTATPALDPTRPSPGVPPRRSATPAQLRWLDGELAGWRADGLVDEATADAIRGRYVAHRRLTLARIVLTLGACFVGLGLVWLVAANLEGLARPVRLLLFLLVLGALAAAALGVARRAVRAGDTGSPVVGALRLLAAAAIGPVLLQGAQVAGLEVGAPWQVALWGVLALAWAYAVRGVAPVVLGVGLLAFAFVHQVTKDGGSGPAAGTLALAASGLAAVAVGVLHLGSGRTPWARSVSTPWREVGAALVLLGLFVAALPFSSGTVRLTAILWGGLAIALVVAAAALLGADRVGRLEVALAVVALAVGAGLSFWRPDVDLVGTGAVTGGQWVRAVLAVALYLAVASGYAVLGGMRDSDLLTWLATGALVVFTTVQAFAVFAPLLSGAALFLAVGVVLIASGVLADRGRRRLLREAREQVA